MRFLVDSGKPNALSAETVKEITDFRDDRHWRPFHNLKDLSLSITLEAAELLECFQWTGHEDDRPEEREHMAEELADVIIYAVLFADRAGFNLDEIVKAKLVKNLRKYPKPSDKTQKEIPTSAETDDEQGVEQGSTTPSPESRWGKCEEIQSEPQLSLSEEGNSVDRDSQEERGCEQQAQTCVANEASDEAAFHVFATFVAQKPVGEWTSDADNRLTFVKYAKPTLDFWQVLAKENVESRETPNDVPMFFGTNVEGLSRAEIKRLFVRLLRLERMRDGLFLEAQSRGVLVRWLTAWFQAKP